MLHMTLFPVDTPNAKNTIWADWDIQLVIILIIPHTNVLNNRIAVSSPLTNL